MEGIEHTFCEICNVFGCILDGIEFISFATIFFQCLQEHMTFPFSVLTSIYPESQFSAQQYLTPLASAQMEQSSQAGPYKT